MRDDERSKPERAIISPHNSKKLLPTPDSNHMWSYVIISTCGCSPLNLHNLTHTHCQTIGFLKNNQQIFWRLFSVWGIILEQKQLVWWMVQTCRHFIFISEAKSLETQPLVENAERCVTVARHYPNWAVGTYTVTAHYLLVFANWLIQISFAGLLNVMSVWWCNVMNSEGCLLKSCPDVGPVSPAGIHSTACLYQCIQAQ